MPYADLEKRKQYLRDYYARNQGKHLQENKDRRKLAQEYVWAQKLGRPCVDCGGSFHPVAMDFDHVNDDKVMDVSKLAGSGFKISKIQEEIDKCELVCSNCHRVRTWERNNAVREQATDAQEA